MALYYSLWLVSMLVMAFPVTTKSQYRIRLIICFLLLFCFGGFRVNFGLDYSNYEDLFNLSMAEHFQYDSEERTEVGYLYLNYFVCNYICSDFRALVVITSLLVCVAYYFVFDWYIPSKYRLLAICLLYLCGNDTVFFMFSGMRNSIAISILLLSLPLVMKRRILPFAAITALAWLFHNSALIVFPIVYLMGGINRVNKTTAVIMISAAVCLFIIPFDWLLGVSADFIDQYFDRYNTYVEDAEAVGAGASYLVALPNLVFISVIVYTLKDAKLPDKVVRLIALGTLLFYFQLLGPLNMRMSIYVGILGIASVILTYPHIKNDILRYSFLSLFILYKVYSFFIVFQSGQYFTYQTVENILLG